MAEELKILFLAAHCWIKVVAFLWEMSDYSQV